MVVMLWEIFELTTGAQALDDQRALAWGTPSHELAWRPGHMSLDDCNAADTAEDLPHRLV